MGAQIVAISTDNVQTLKRYKEELHAPYTFLADPEGLLAEMFGVKTPLLTFAKRVTFVIGRDLTIQRIDEGGDALDPVGALKGCHVASPK